MHKTVLERYNNISSAVWTRPAYKAGDLGKFHFANPVMWQLGWISTKPTSIKKMASDEDYYYGAKNKKNEHLALEGIDACRKNREFFLLT